MFSDNARNTAQIHKILKGVGCPPKSRVRVIVFSLIFVNFYVIFTKRQGHFLLYLFTNTQIGHLLGKVHKSTTFYNLILSIDKISNIRYTSYQHWRPFFTVKRSEVGCMYIQDVDFTIVAIDIVIHIRISCTVFRSLVKSIPIYSLRYEVVEHIIFLTHPSVRHQYVVTWIAYLHLLSDCLQIWMKV